MHIIEYACVALNPEQAPVEQNLAELRSALEVRERQLGERQIMKVPERIRQ